jgi:protein involved in polysaccharide export with SLBB domain
MYQIRPKRVIVAWLTGCLMVAGCRGLPSSPPNPATSADFCQAKSPETASPLRADRAIADLGFDDSDDQPVSSVRLASAAEGELLISQNINDPGSNLKKDGESQKAEEAQLLLDPPSSILACTAEGVHGPHGDVPRELAKIVIADYTIEPPDILLVEAIPSLPDQPVQGEHLVRPDGTINLGTYGSVRVAGLSIDLARAVIKDQLSKFIKNVKVNVDVYAYNSKVIYVIADGAGFGQPMFRLPFTGNETVLDAISQIGGLPATASKKKIWIARPGPDDSVQTLPIDWKGITQDGLVRTNYQLFPGDRIYIQSDRLMALDGVVTKIVTPIERVFGMTYLGAQTIFRLQNMGRGVGQGTGF